MTTWWEARPERWAKEQEALKQVGLQYRIDEAARARGVMQLMISRPYNGREIPLSSTYPAEFPFFPPLVVPENSELIFARHQTPGSGQLCLLADDGNQWNPETDTLAWMLTEQWDLLLGAQPGPAQNVDAESRQAEPIAAYLHVEPESFVGFPEFRLESLPSNGQFRFAVENLLPLRGTVLELLGPDGRLLALSEARTRSDYPEDHPILTGRWVKLSVRPQWGSANDYYHLASQADARLQTHSWQTLPNREGRIDLAALLFPDEITWRQEGGNVIVMSKSLLRRRDGGREAIPLLHYAETESHRLYALRDPSAPVLHDAKVTLVGLGSVGSPTAKLLAQAGMGRLAIVDHDKLQAGNAVRWETGRAYAGRAKVSALAELIRQNFPYTSIESSIRRLGDPAYAGSPEERRLYDLLFDGTTCIADASAANNVTHFLAVEAWQRRVPFAWFHATNGGWGGLVGAVAPTDPNAPCWMCHLYYLQDGHIEPIASAPEEDTVHPHGCVDPTFTGSQVDLAEVSLMAVRLICDRVRAARNKQAVPELGWTVATVRLRNQVGHRIAPEWRTYRLERHAKCPNH